MYNGPAGNAFRVFLSIGVFYLCLLSAYAQGVTGRVPENTELSEIEQEIPVFEEDAVPYIDRNDPTFWIHKIDAWRTAIEQHTPGEADEAAIAVGSWDEEDLRRIMLVIEELTAEKWGSSRYSHIVKETLNGLSKKTAISLLRFDESRDPILKRGVLLHTDIALLQLEKGKEENNKSIVQFGDGRGTVQSKGWHMEYACQLLSLFSSDPLHRELKRQWYISTTAHLLAMHNFAHVEDNLQYALESYPSDATLLFYAGTLHENFALPKIQNALAPPGSKLKLDSKKSELKQARSFFQKAIEVDPAFSEARLHLGRVLGLLGDHDRAVDVLRQASSFLTESRLRYYCSLFLGKELTILNRHEEACKQYEHAAMLYPTAQSALLSLSRLAHVKGNNKEALLGVAKVIALPEENNISEDPWWFYDVFHARDASELIYELYNAFGEQP